MARAYIGTSGWHYDDWRGRFYPEDAGKSDFLRLYAQTFRAVEINNTFYSLPRHRTLTHWRDTVPEDFVFACKASRFITHMKKLKDPTPSTGKFFAAIAALDGKLGPVLFQLPPNWNVNVDRLCAFLDALPPACRYTFEFRDDSWHCKEVYDLLGRHNAALCIYNMGATVSPVEVTADFVYVRLHGPTGRYQGSYEDSALEEWARRVGGWCGQGRDVYCFFDNDQKAYAPRDAARLMDMLGTGRK